MSRTRSSSLGQISSLISKCGRSGCSPTVQNGMQCATCSVWYHPKCTGLKKVQYNALAKSDTLFKCMCCIYDEPRPSTELLKSTEAKNKKTPKDPQNAGKPSVEDYWTPKALDSLSKECKGIQKELQESKLQIGKLTEDIASLNEFLALSIPGPRAAKEALKMSKATIRNAAKELTEQTLRERRIII